MTYHAIMTFFGPRGDAGYLLGTDSRAAIEHTESGARLCVQRWEKGFVTDNAVGIIMGEYSQEHAEAFSKELVDLGTAFEHGTLRGDHTNGYAAQLPLLGRSQKYRLRACRRKQDRLEFLSFGTASPQPNIMHTLFPSVYEEESTVWWSPLSLDRMIVLGTQRKALPQAQELVRNLLDPPAELKELLGIEPEYEPGEPFMYVVSPSFVGRI